MEDFLDILLDKRGIKEDEKDIFLNPNYERDLHDPFLMRDMEKSCVRIFEAIENNEKIMVFADYDCDGIPGAVMLNDFFKKIGYKNFEIYIPARNSEGYGLNLSAIKEFAKKEVKLLITVDLGITANKEIAQAEIEGIETIITDHHIPHLDIPKAYAILNPKIDDYKEKMLCGSGVVFKLVQGFLIKYGEYFKVNKGWEKWLLDMAGIATLSDMVPLRGENRAIAYFGLQVLKKTRRVGLNALLLKLKINKDNITEDDVGFMIAPRINAASRMDDPMRSFELLSTEDVKEAENLANHLSKINDERKFIVAGIMKEVNKTLEKRENKDVILIGNPSWRVGVLGLVAGKVCDTYKRPVFVWGKDENNMIKGSCRADDSCSVVELMTEIKDCFIEFGGHEGAGGFTVHNDKIHFMEESLLDAFSKVKRKKEEGQFYFDIKTDLSIVNKKTWKEITKLAPFGFDNPKPVFLFENLKIINIKKFGKNNSQEHLEIIFTDSSNKNIKAIAFFRELESFKSKIEKGLSISLLANFEFSFFAGREELRLRIIDIF